MDIFAPTFVTKKSSNKRSSAPRSSSLKTRDLCKNMESFAGPVAAGIIMSSLNKYVLDFKWCTVLQTWCEGEDEWCDDDDEDEGDMTPASSTAISTDATMTHHIGTHAH